VTLSYSTTSSQLVPGTLVGTAGPCATETSVVPYPFSSVRPSAVVPSGKNAYSAPYPEFTGAASTMTFGEVITGAGAIAVVAFLM
jgi:hypothetical protein